MATASDSSTDQTVSLPLLDLRLLSQSELHTLSLSASTGLHCRSDDDNFIPKIDRSVFNESAGSRKQTFSRLRLAPRNDKQKSAVRASSSSSAKIPLHIPESVENENLQIIGHLQDLFGVEALRAANNNGVVPLQIEFKQPSQDDAPEAILNVPIDAAVPNGGQKRKRGRPSMKESMKESLGPPVGKVAGNGKTVETAKNKNGGLVVDDIGDPFGEELIGRTQGSTTESELLEFLEGLHGEWGSKFKKRRIVEATELCDLLPAGWKLVLNLQRRAGRASVVCRRYVSPDGRQFDSYKDVSSYLVSVFGVQDKSHLKCSYSDGSQKLSSNINMVPEHTVSHISTGGIMSDGDASSHHEKQAPITISSPIGTEKLNTSDGNFNSDLAFECKLGVTTSGAFKDSDAQTEDKQPLKVDKNEENSVQGCSLAEDRVYIAIEASDAACDLPIPLLCTNPNSNNNNSGINQISDEIKAVPCIKSSISNTENRDTNTGCSETGQYGNEEVHVTDNGLGLSVPFVEDHIQKFGFERSMLVTNSEGRIFAGNNLDDKHLIASVEDMESNDGLIKDDNQQIFSCRDQPEIKDVSTNAKLLCSSESSLVPDTSINSMDSTKACVLNYFDEGNFFDNESIACIERASVHSGYPNDLSFSDWPQDPSESGGVEIFPTDSMGMPKFR